LLYVFQGQSPATFVGLVNPKDTIGAEHRNNYPIKINKNRKIKKMGVAMQTNIILAPIEFFIV